MLLGDGYGLLLPALCDVGDNAWWHLRQLCVELKVLDAEGGQAVVDVTGGAAVGGHGGCGSVAASGAVVSPNPQLLCLLQHTGVSDCCRACLAAALLSVGSLLWGFSGGW